MFRKWAKTREGEATCWNRDFGDPFTNRNAHKGAVRKERKVETNENEGSTYSQNLGKKGARSVQIHGLPCTKEGETETGGPDLLEQGLWEFFDGQHVHKKDQTRTFLSQIKAERSVFSA